MTGWYRRGALDDLRWPGGKRAMARCLLAALAAGTQLILASGPAPGASPPVATPEPPDLNRSGVPVRIRIDALDIDLPVVSSDTEVRDNPPGYPLCDVAQYWTSYDLPGAPGTTWIYGHAQPGMLLPLLEVAEATDGSGLRGLSVSLQLADGRLLTYRIDTVKQHAVDRSIAQDRARQEHRLVLHTSEGPSGTIPKLQMAGRLVDATRTDEPAPRARPRACSSPPRRTPGPDRPGRSAPPGSPVAGASLGLAPIDIGPVRIAPTAVTLDGLASTLVGAGFVLVGAALMAWGIVGRRV